MVYVNASPQCRESFYNTQWNRTRRLLLIQDVKTRWHSTCHMLIRAHKLCSHIMQWLHDDHHRETLGLTNVEWKQVEYLIELSLLYCQLGNAIAKTKSVTVHNVFPIYDSLFNHLRDSIARLKQKKDAWKRSILMGLIAARDKLHKYYSRTYGQRSDLAAIATILSPDLKLSAFDNITWEAEW